MCTGTSAYTHTCTYNPPYTHQEIMVSSSRERTGKVRNGWMGDNSEIGLTGVSKTEEFKGILPELMVLGSACQDKEA